jgi:hypothetical protein
MPSLSLSTVYRILDSLEELLLIKGMKPETYYGKEGQEGLRDYLTVHSDGRININTAGLLILHHFEVPMIGGDHHGKSCLLCCFHYPAETLIDHFDGLHGCRKHSRVADHVRIGIVHQDEPVFPREDPLDQLIRQCGEIALDDGQGG